MVAIALLLGMPFFVFFGWLSDRIGRKWIIMAGLLLAMFSYLPIYRAMQFVTPSDVLTVTSQRNPATGAITLTPMTRDSYPGGNFYAAPKVFEYKSISDLLSQPRVWILVFLIFIQVIWVTMVYGPIAAYLVEAFPTKIRYTALSLPYHIGNGVFGGLLPVIGLSVVASTGNIYAGLYYPMIVAGITFIVGSIFLKETHGHRIWEEVRNS
jgi:MFS family permease